MHRGTDAKGAKLSDEHPPFAPSLPVACQGDNARAPPRKPDKNPFKREMLKPAIWPPPLQYNLRAAHLRLSFRQVVRKESDSRGQTCSLGLVFIPC